MNDDCLYFSQKFVISFFVKMKSDYTPNFQLKDKFKKIFERSDPNSTVPFLRNEFSKMFSYFLAILELFTKEHNSCYIN